jgi:hypothetical protein
VACLAGNVDALSCCCGALAAGFWCQGGGFGTIIVLTMAGGDGLLGAEVGCDLLRVVSLKDIVV